MRACARSCGRVRRALSARLIACVACSLGGFASAQSPSEREATPLAGVTVVAPKATSVAGVTVVGRRCVPAATNVDPAALPPSVIATYPHEGEIAPPGYLALRLAFDQPMSDCSFSFSPDFPLKFPEITGRPPVLLPGGKVFVLLVQVRPGRQYAVKLNAPGRAYFISRSGLAAPPLELRFSTSTAPPLSAEQAMRVQETSSP